jgi:hypothetical protein
MAGYMSERLSTSGWKFSKLRISMEFPSTINLQVLGLLCDLRRQFSRSRLGTKRMKLDKCTDQGLPSLARKKFGSENGVVQNLFSQLKIYFAITFSSATATSYRP